MSRRLGPRDFLEYNADFRILICRECHYAIQKDAIESHLLKHKIYRGQRHKLITEIGSLDLLDPASVRDPPHGSSPIPSIPVLSGYRCLEAGCRQLTASSKRMQKHWTDTHGKQYNSQMPPLSVFAVPVSLQTFFRGARLKYFEVHSPSHDLDRARLAPNAPIDTGEPGIIIESHPHTLLQLIPHPGQAKDRETFDLSDMTYFYHFIMYTCRTLPTVSAGTSALEYWQVHAMAIALQDRITMQALLALAAFHLAYLTHDPIMRATHLAWAHGGMASRLSRRTEAREQLASPPPNDDELSLEAQLESLLGLAEQSSSPLNEWNKDKAAPSTKFLDSFLINLGGYPAVVPNDGPNAGYDSNYPISRSATQTLPEDLVSHGVLYPVTKQYLQALPSRLSSILGRPDNPEDIVAILAAINALLLCCESSWARDEAGNIWRSILTWYQSVSAHFRHLTSTNHSAALIVLAHWVVLLVRPGEKHGCWFLHGAAKTIMAETHTQFRAVFNEDQLRLIADIFPDLDMTTLEGQG